MATRQTRFTDTSIPVSEVPSYHSNAHHNEPIPAYSPAAPRAGTASRTSAPARHQTIGLPPVPSMPQINIPNIHNFRAPMWSANNALAARQYHNVAERRISDGRYTLGAGGGPGAGMDRHTQRRTGTPERVAEQHGATSNSRPLEDPYLVGEEAAALARRERLARENGDDILIREDKHWDWFLGKLSNPSLCGGLANRSAAQMKNWEERERNWAKFRQDTTQRRKLLRRFGGGLL